MYPPTPPKPASTTGPKILTFSGIAVLLIGIVALIIAITSMVSTLPLNVITSQGQPGSGSLAGLTVNEDQEFTSLGGLSYDLWEVQQSPNGQFALDRKSVTVIGPDGARIAVRGSEVSGSTSVAGFKAQSFASFSAQQAGSYTIAISPGPDYVGPSSHSSGAAGSSANNTGTVDAIITESSEFSTLFTGIFTFIGGIMVGIAGLLLGGGMTIGGIAWWINANGRRKRGFAPGV